MLITLTMWQVILYATQIWLDIQRTETDVSSHNNDDNKWNTSRHAIILLTAQIVFKVEVEPTFIKVCRKSEEIILLSGQNHNVLINKFEVTVCQILRVKIIMTSTYYYFVHGICDKWATSQVIVSDLSYR